MVKKKKKSSILNFPRYMIDKIGDVYSYPWRKHYTSKGREADKFREDVNLDNEKRKAKEEYASANQVPKQKKLLGKKKKKLIKRY